MNLPVARGVPTCCRLGSVRVGDVVRGRLFLVIWLSVGRYVRRRFRIRLYFLLALLSLTSNNVTLRN